MIAETKQPWGGAPLTKYGKDTIERKAREFAAEMDDFARALEKLEDSASGLEHPDGTAPGFALYMRLREVRPLIGSIAVEAHERVGEVLRSLDRA